MKTKFIPPIICLLFLGMSPVISAQKITVEDLIDRHLASIAPRDKFSSIKSFIAVGEVRVEHITQKNLPAAGRIVIASDGDKIFLGMQLNATDYPQERIVFDGDKTSVAFVRPGIRSVLGNFLQSNSSILSQGLISGILSTSWALGSVDERRPKLSLDDSKKIDGKDVYTVTYAPKGGGDLNITLYFDQQNYRHIRTEYKRTTSANIGRTIDESARQSESRLKVTEEFSDFKEFQNVIIPHKYKLNYSITGVNGTTELSWTCEFTEFAINPQLDPKTFDRAN